MEGFLALFQGSTKWCAVTFPLAADPQDPLTLYAATDSGEGIFKTSDAGKTWKQVEREQIHHPWGDEIIVDPTDPRNVWYVADMGLIFKSENAGRTWTAQNPDLRGFSSSSIYAMTADPKERSRIYVAKNGFGIHRSDDGGDEWKFLQFSVDYTYSIAVDPERNNIVFLSRDEGETWEVWFDAGEEYSGIATMCFDPADSGVVYASGVKRDGVEGTLWRITAGEGADITGDLPRAAACLVIDPNNRDSIQAALLGKGLYSTHDGGRTWEEAEAFPDIHIRELALAPGNPSTLYAATIGHEFESDRVSEQARNRMGRSGLYKSTDGGQTWQYAGSEQFRDLKTAAVAVYGKSIFAATEKGIFVSRAAGGCWQDISEGLHFKDTGVLALCGETLYAGTHGGGVFVGEAGRKPAWQNTGPVVKVVNVQLKVHPKNSETLYASSYPGGFFASFDRGKTWHGRNVASASFADLVGRAPNVAGGLNPVTSGDDPDIQRSYPFDICAANPVYMYLATYEGGLFVTLDGANTWTPVTALNEMVEELRITGVHFDRHHTDTVYVTANQGFFTSRDCGSTWTALNKGLACRDVYSMAITRDGQIFAGTRGYGVFKFRPIQKRWTQLRGPQVWGIHWPMWRRSLYQYTSLASSALPGAYLLSVATSFGPCRILTIGSPTS